METYIRETPGLILAEDCQKFLDLFIAKQKAKREANDNFDGEQHEFENLHTDPDFKTFDSIVREIADREVNAYVDGFRHLENMFYQESSVLLRLPQNTPLKLHYDLEVSHPDDLKTGDFQRRYFAVLCYLQDLPDGQLYFPSQKKIIRPEAGKFVVFPTFFTHPHTVFPASVDRYTYRINYCITESLYGSQSNY